MNFVAIGIDPTEGPDVLQAYRDAMGYPWTVALGEREVLERYGVVSTAIKYGVDRQGVITFHRGWCRRRRQLGSSLRRADSTVTAARASGDAHVFRIEPQGLGFALLGLVLGGVLLAPVDVIYEIQAGVLTFALLLPLGYAFAAGMVATVNPCGVLLLPSLVALYLSRDGGDDPKELTPGRRTARALLLALMATLGFVALFGLVGFIIGACGMGARCLLPDCWWVADRNRPCRLGRLARPHRTRIRHPRRQPGDGTSRAWRRPAVTLLLRRRVRGDIACLHASDLSGRRGPALAAGSVVAATGQFVSYALGMGSVLTAVILGAAFFQAVVQRSVRRVVPYVHRLSASFLLGAGLFVAHYWAKGAGLFGGY